MAGDIIIHTHKGLILDCSSEGEVSLKKKIVLRYILTSNLQVVLTPGKSEISNLHIKNAEWVLVIEKEVCVIYVPSFYMLTRKGHFQNSRRDQILVDLF